MIIIQDDRKFVETPYSKEIDLENDLVRNAPLFFGQNTIYIEAKKKIQAKELG